MKEAFWGVLIVMLGLLGIVIINVFQKITTTNDETYYLMKEVTEAAAYDAIDLTYYRLNGDLRIVEDKFVENFTRRFAQSLSNRGNYTITIQDILEQPPKLSLSIRTGITSLQGEAFGIVNRTDGILETKYKIEDVTDFLGITVEEWINRTNVNTNVETGENACNITTVSSEEYECIPGDVEFSEWEDITVQNNACDTDTLNARTIKATYKTCDCGKWTSNTREVSATPRRVGNYFTYTWNIKVDGEIRSINETKTKRVAVDICTTSVEIWVPKDLRTKEPSSDNSSYEKCPANGIRIPSGTEVVMHGNYIPTNASNRTLTWKSSTNVVSLQSSNPNTNTGYSRGSVTGKSIGVSNISVTSTNNRTSTCKVEVWDGNVDTISCTNKTVEEGTNAIMQSSYTPYNANKLSFTWSSSNTGVATINSTTGAITALKGGSTTITVTSEDGKKSGTCTLTVNAKPVIPPPPSGGGTCSCTGDVVYDQKWIPSQPAIPPGCRSCCTPKEQRIHNCAPEYSPGRDAIPGYMKYYTRKETQSGSTQAYSKYYYKKVCYYTKCVTKNFTCQNKQIACYLTE